ncbi:hypothetical protein QMK17_22280 [Rhodococcus sp. G-MC3]|uniref:hypothetical protein n=1 Tax=Rhodococcus sp. G-MC3 TaxID=3046209 RepID=UPI0024BB7DB7|nr:hypothetical protein [Rhodococcus sp. G-MC3]MDJ0396054.1 hypothetical protein [Rhodococcus sp. G-MC3]
MRTWILAAGMVALTVAGCSSEQSAEPEAGAARPGSDLAAEAGSTEVEGPHPRLVVADADSGRIEVIDLATEGTVGTFELDNPTSLTTVNGRYIVAADDQHAHILDPGSWSIDHGDHSHSYVKEPVAIGTLEGDGPAQVTAGDRKVAVPFDGRTDIVDFDSLSAGNADIATTIDREGAVVPIKDQFVAVGDTLELLDSEGESVRTLDGSCPEVQGKAVFSSYFLVACADGALKVDGTDFTTAKFPYPVTRALSLDQGSGTLVTAPTATGILVLDTRSGEWVEAKTSDAAVSSGISSDGKTAFSLQADGTFRTFDAATGAQLSSTPVGAGSSIEVAGTRAYVADSTARTVVEIDFSDGGRIARTLDLDFAPGSIGVVGA